MILVTTRVERTMKNTEQKARQKWHLCRFKSLHWYIVKNLVEGQHFCDLGIPLELLLVGSSN